MKRDWLLLNQYLPNGAFYVLLPLLPTDLNFHLIIDRERKTMLGNYTYDPYKKNHTVRINYTLNPYAFLITLVHEIAHYRTFLAYQNKVLPHGKEWKDSFQSLLNPFLSQQIFPTDITAYLTRPSFRLKASSCTDTMLYKILKKYDKKDENALLYIEEVPMGSKFTTGDGRIFQLIEKRRKNYKAKELATHRYYIFNPICEVALLT